MELFVPLNLAIARPIRAPTNAGISQPIPSLYKGINSKYGVINETEIPPCFNPSNTLTTALQLKHLHKQSDIHRSIYEVMIVVRVQSQLDTQQVELEQRLR